MASRKTSNNKKCDEILGRRKKRNKLKWLKKIHRNFFGSINDVDYPDVLKWFLVTQKALERNPCRLRNDVQLPPVNIHQPYSMPQYNLNYIQDVLASPFIIRRIDAIDEPDTLFLPHRLDKLCNKRCFLDSFEDDYMGWSFIQKHVYPYRLPHSKFYKRHIFDSTFRWQKVVDRGDMYRYLVRQIRRIERNFIKRTRLDILPMAALRYNSPFHIQELEVWKDYARDRKMFPKYLNMAYIRRNMDTIRDEDFIEITPCMLAAFKEFKNTMSSMIDPRSFYYNEIWQLFHNNLFAVMNQICDPISPSMVNILIKQFGKYVAYIKSATEKLKYAIEAEKQQSHYLRSTSFEQLIQKFEEKNINVPRILEFPYCNYERYGYRVSKRHDEDKPNCHIIHLEAPGLRADRFDPRPAEHCHLPPSSEEEEEVNPCEKKCSSEESVCDENDTRSDGHGLCLEVDYDRPKFRDRMKTVYVSNEFWQLLNPIPTCSLDDADALSNICKLQRSLEPGTCLGECECESCKMHSDKQKPIRRRILGLKPLSKKKAIETKLIHSLITGNLGKTDKEEDVHTDNIARGRLLNKWSVDPKHPSLGTTYYVDLDDLKFNELVIALLGQWINLGIFGKELPLVKVNKPVQTFPFYRNEAEEEEEQLGEGEGEEGIQVKQYMIPYVEFILKELMGEKEPGDILKAVVKKHLRRSKEQAKKDLATKSLSFSIDYLLKPFIYKKGVLSENPKLWKTCNKGTVYKKEDEIKNLGKYLLVNLIENQLNEVHITREDEECNPELVDFAECLLNIFNEYFEEDEFYHYGDDEEIVRDKNEDDEIDAKTRCQDENQVFESLINCLINHLPVKEILTEIFGRYRERTRRFELIQAFREDEDPEFCNLVAPIIRALQGLDERSTEEEKEEEKGERIRKKKKIRTKEWNKLILIAQDVVVRSNTLLSHIRLFKVEQLLDHSYAHESYKLDCDLVHKMLAHSKEIHNIKVNTKAILLRMRMFFKILFAVETRAVKIGISQFFLNLVEQEKEKTTSLKEITKILIAKLRYIINYITSYQMRDNQRGFNMYRFIYYLDNVKDDIEAINKITQLIIENLVNNKPLKIHQLKQILETKAAAIKSRRKFELIPGYGRDFESQEWLPYAYEGRREGEEERYPIGEGYKHRMYEGRFEGEKRKTEPPFKPKKRRKRRRKPVFWNDMLLFMARVQYRIRNIDQEKLQQSVKPITYVHRKSTEDSISISKTRQNERNIQMEAKAIDDGSDSSENEQYKSEESKNYKKNNIITKLSVKRTISIDKNNYKEKLSKTFIKQETNDKQVISKKTKVTSKYSIYNVNSESDSDVNPFEDEFECKELRSQLKQVRRRNEFENEMRRYCNTLRSK